MDTRSRPNVESPSPYRPLRIALWVLLGVAVVYGVLGALGWGPPAANEQAIGQVSRWCERVSGGFFREPINALANLGFVVAGLWMFWVLARDEEKGVPKRNPFIGNQPIALLYAAAAVFLGPGSMLMHGGHTRYGAWLDNVSMVAYILVPWLFNLSLLGRWRQKTLFTTYGVLLAVYAAGYWFIGPDLGIGLDFFGVSIGIWVVSEFLFRFWSPVSRWLSGLVGIVVAAAFGITPDVMLADPARHWWVLLLWLPGLLASGPPTARRRYIPWFWVGMASFFVAYAIWLTGKNTFPGCRPDALLQGHAVWHLLSALATVGFFLFFRTQRPLEATADPA